MNKSLDRANYYSSLTALIEDHERYYDIVYHSVSTIIFKSKHHDLLYVEYNHDPQKGYRITCKRYYKEEGVAI